MLLNYEDVVVLPVGLQPTVCGFGRRRFLRLSYGSRKNESAERVPQGVGFRPCGVRTRNWLLSKPALPGVPVQGAMNPCGLLLRNGGTGPVTIRPLWIFSPSANPSQLLSRGGVAGRS